MALDLKRFPGFAYGLAYNGLVTLISPLWTSECEFFEEEEKRKYMRNLQNEFIEATKETERGIAFAASQRVRQNPQCGIHLDCHPGEWLIHMGEGSGPDGEGIAIAWLYGGGNVLMVLDGDTILRLRFGNSSYWADERGDDDDDDDEGYSGLIPPMPKCRWCGREEHDGQHEHAGDAERARQLLFEICESKQEAADTATEK
jgi:hypothetical protein